jgi:8-oxo-dGTP diphosphatase
MRQKFLSPWDLKQKVCKALAKQVVTLFLRKGERFLVLQRAKKDAQYGLWGIPGGKLDKGEHPTTGLIRELKEETGIVISDTECTLLDTAISHTSCDGKYGLHLYHAHAPLTIEVNINPEEHLAHRWVTLEEFERLELLFAQREAFHLVKELLTTV